MKRLLFILAVALTVSSCMSCNENPETETRTFELQLITGDTVTESFEVPVNSEVRVASYRGSYYLEYKNDEVCCCDNNLLNGVVYIIKEK